MPKKEKVISLFEKMLSKTDNQDNEDSDAPVQQGGNGHVIVTGGSNTINVYNRDTGND